jgi:hypothetical protein
MVTTRKDQFPCMYEWQNLQAGQYVLGIEPSTHHVLGNGAARDRGEMIWLQHDECCQYDTEFSILTNNEDIAAAESRITGISAQPQEDFPEPSGSFYPIGGKG